MRRLTSLILSLAAVLLVSAPGTASAATCPDADTLPGAPTFDATAPAATLCLLNNERTAAGLVALRLGPPELADPAVAYAKDMVARKFFSHESPDGIKLLQRLASYTIGATWSIGENLAWGESSLGSPAAIVRAWMNSPGHRRNILDGTFREIGIAVVPGAPSDVSRPSATYVTEFGVRAVSGTPATTQPGGTAGKTARSATAAKKKAKRCRKVTRKVRRNGKLVKVKKTVCTKAKKSAKR